VIKQCTIVDYPRMGMRGIHLGLPPREEIGFFRRLVRYLFVPMRLNTIFLEFAGGMRYDRHPEINEAWVNANKKGEAKEWPLIEHGDMDAGGRFLEKSEVAELVEYARSYGLEVIPEVQTLSHVQYITVAHPDIAEFDPDVRREHDLDLRDADKLPSEFYYHSYCPSMEKSYKIAFDLIDEIVEVVKPKEFVHMGHDEVYQIGICPRCKGKDPADLYAEHVTRMHDYLAKKGLRMMIWSDMLQPDTSYKTPPAISRIPKDIVMLDFIWYFHPEKDLEDNLLKHGFKVIAGNMYSSHYTRYESRIVKPGMIGAQISTWCRIDEYTLAREGKMFDIVYSANMMWTAAYNSQSRYTYEKIIRDMTPRLRSQLHGKKYPTQYLNKTSVPLKLPEAKHAVPAELIHALPCLSSYEINNVLFDFSSVSEVVSQLEIKVQDKLDSVVFLQASAENEARIPWKSLRKVGQYFIKYEDGTEAVVPIEYGGNIGAWDRRYAAPMLPGYYRHNGYISTYYSDPYIQAKSFTGKDVTVYGYEWLNPYKDKKIASIICMATNDTDAAIILFSASGIKVNQR
jgi:hexosaminidase